MARMVKCNATGISGNSTDFYKVGNKWYQNEEIYKNYIENKKYFEEFINRFKEILGYKDILPSKCGGLICKKVKESGISYKELYQSLLEKEDYIKETFTGLSNHYFDAQHIIGIFTIISTIPESITYGGCYEIKSLKSGKIYIGETLDMFQRLSTHVSELYAGNHHCTALQEEFNIYNDFSHFQFSPLYLYEIKNKNREKEKHNTLYLECAYFLKYKNQKKELLNTINPYIALKENSVTLNNYNIDCKYVLDLLMKDEKNILSNTLKEKIKKDLNKK